MMKIAVAKKIMERVKDMLPTLTNDFRQTSEFI